MYNPSIARFDFHVTVTKTSMFYLQNFVTLDLVKQYQKNITSIHK